MMDMKIRTVYAAGPIQSVNNRTQTLKQLVSICKSLGLKVGSGLWNADLKAENRENLVYEGDCELIDASDAVIAEISRPSLGIGYEIGRAIHYNKIPVLAVARKDAKNISSMILGNRNITVKRYRNLKELRKIIKEWIQNARNNK